MIPLNTTWDNILMLLIAGGVGLIGGVGAALLETRREGTATASGWKAFAGSVILGGIAAVAILYFFPPQETIVKDGVSTSQYDLTRLVALALIVGSAGTSFLLTLQTRAMALVAEKQAKTTEETAQQTVGAMGEQMPVIGKASVEGAAPLIQKALENASKLEKRSQVTPAMVQAVTDELGSEVKRAVEVQIDPMVKGAQKTIQAAGPSEATSPGDDKVL